MLNKHCTIVLNNHWKRAIFPGCKLSTKPDPISETKVQNSTYKRDDWTNITPRILSHVGRNLHLQKNHPLNLVQRRIREYFYKSFINTRGNPIFSVYDNLQSVVSIDQNFNSILIPEDHPSRAKTDCYYLNKNYLLRGHMTAHQAELIGSGLNDFLIIGDVYRRDEIDSTHYPVFHQIDGVRLKTRDQLFPSDDGLSIFEVGASSSSEIQKYQKQNCHTLEAVKLMEHELKSTLLGLAKHLFGNDIRARWVTTYFPFTEPSWELEVFNEDKWLEVLGCGIMRQEIVANAGVHDRIGWAFGLGLERIAMCLYKIPDIRIFWSNDSGFLNQFNDKSLHDKIVYKPISVYPQCNNDISFWLPQDSAKYSSNDFYDLVRNLGGDIVEQVTLIDEFKHPKNGKVSHCYRITYRHMERTLLQEEVNEIHKQIEKFVSEKLGVTIR